MNLRIFAFICILLTVFSGSSYSKEMSDSSAGKSFSPTATFSFQGKEYTLSGTGVSTRGQGDEKMYTVAGYIEDPASVKGEDVFTNILDSKKAKQITILWLMKLEGNRVQEEFRDAIGEVTGNAALIVQFANFFEDVKIGDTHIIRWMPDGTLTVSYNGKEKGKMRNGQFSKEVWSIWYGEDSVVDRDKLVSLIRK